MTEARKEPGAPEEVRGQGLGAGEGTAMGGPRVQDFKKMYHILHAPGSQAISEEKGRSER